MRVYVYVNVYIYIYIYICICAVEKFKSPPIYSQTNGRQDDNSQRGAIPPRWERVGFGLLSGSNGFDIRGTRAALFSEKTSSEAVPVPMFGMISGEGHIRGTRFKLHRSKDFTQT